MALLDESVWGGRIFSDGWSAGGGDPLAVTSPAAGEALGTIGGASPEDVSRVRGAPMRRAGTGRRAPTPIGRRCSDARAICGMRTARRSPVG